MNYFYGGAFNPVTKAHLFIIETLLKELKDDDILHIGITEHDYKIYNYSYEDRKEFINANLQYNYNKYWLCQKLRIIKQNKRTWNFLNDYFQNNTNVILILGEDEYNDLKSLNIWHYSKEILEKYPIKVFSRSNETQDISATKVRQLLSEHADYSQLEKYITKITYNLLN